MEAVNPSNIDRLTTYVIFHLSGFLRIQEAPSSNLGTETGYPD
jgi:hypothetical protein